MITQGTIPAPPFSRNASAVLALEFLSIVLAGCASRIVRSPAPFDIHSSSYIDLQPGWRLRVTTPLLKSGGYVLKDTVQSTSRDGALIIETGDDFIGYETSYYAVGRNGPGVKIEFKSTEVTRDGETFSQRQPKVALFTMPRPAKYVRLLFIRRVSEADHDMAVVAAERIETLERLTQSVQTDPQACLSKGATYCSWIPLGIAVRPELLKGKDWVSVTR